MAPDPTRDQSSAQPPVAGPGVGPAFDGRPAATVPVALLSVLLAALLGSVLVPLRVPGADGAQVDRGYLLAAALTVVTAALLLAVAVLDHWGPTVVRSRREVGVAVLTVTTAVAAAQALLIGRPWAGVAVMAVALGAGLLRLAGTTFAVLLASAGVVWFAAAVAAVVAGAPLQGWVPVSTGVAVCAVLAFAARTGRLRAMAQVAAAEETLVSIDVHDTLTAALNRRGLEMVATPMIEHARRQGGAVSALFVDVDGVGPVNAALGVEAGDAVICAVAEQLRACVRSTDVVCRWGGDEFVVVGPGTGMSPLELERRARALLVEVPPVEVAVWAPKISVGSATLVPWDDGNLASLLERAEQDLRLRRSLRRSAAVPDPGVTPPATTGFGALRPDPKS